MKTKKIDAGPKTLLVISPLYDKLDKLLILESMIKDNHIIVLLGDSCFPYTKHNEVPPRINQIKLFMENKDAHYVLGDKDLIFMQKTALTHEDNFQWLGEQPSAIRFMFDNQTSALIVHGGILPKHTTWGELNTDLEVSFIKNIPNSNKNWHEIYNGRFGYCLSSHPANQENMIQKYNHSVSLDTSAHETDRVAVQEFSEKGLGQTFYI